MALRDPNLGDEAVGLLRDAIMTATRAAYPATSVKTVGKYQGPVTAETIVEFSTKAPAIVFTIEGIGEVVPTGSQLQMPVLFAASVITKPKQDGDADDPCAAIAARFLRLAINNTWGVECDAPEEMRVRNIYTGKLGKVGVNVWTVSWAQVVTASILTAADLEALPDLERIHTTYTLEDDAPTYEQRTEFE